MKAGRWEETPLQLMISMVIAMALMGFTDLSLSAVAAISFLVYFIALILILTTQYFLERRRRKRVRLLREALRRRVLARIEEDMREVSNG